MRTELGFYVFLNYQGLTISVVSVFRGAGEGGGWGRGGAVFAQVAKVLAPGAECLSEDCASISVILFLSLSEVVFSLFKGCSVVLLAVLLSAYLLDAHVLWLLKEKVLW